MPKEGREVKGGVTSALPIGLKDAAETDTMMAAPQMRLGFTM
jgi:hypothetical protein